MYRRIRIDSQVVKSIKLQYIITLRDHCINVELQFVLSRGLRPASQLQPQHKTDPNLVANR